MTNISCEPRAHLALAMDDRLILKFELGVSARRTCSAHEHAVQQGKMSWRRAK
jgi:hypothetical protein